MRTKILLLLLVNAAVIQLCQGKSVWEQMTGTKPPIEVTVPTPQQILNDPGKTLVNPQSYINTTGIPTQGDFFEFVIKNPDGAIELVQNPGNWIYTPVATAIIAGRNAALARGVQPIPDNIKQALRKWYPDDLLNSVRWTSN